MITKLLLVVLALLSGHPVTSTLSSIGERLAAAPALASEPVATIQIELLPDFEGAEQLADSVRERLATAGLSHPVFVEIIPGEPELPVSYRVVIGPFFDFEEAERARTQIEAIGVNGFVREFEPVIGC